MIHLVLYNECIAMQLSSSTRMSCYLQVRILCGMPGSDKERKECPEKAEEWDSKLAEHSAHRMASWLQQVEYKRGSRKVDRPDHIVSVGVAMV